MSPVSARAGNAWVTRSFISLVDERLHSPDGSSSVVRNTKFLKWKHLHPNDRFGPLFSFYRPDRVPRDAGAYRGHFFAHERQNWAVCRHAD